jgi:N-acetyl sugar amidotransferase
MKYCKECLLPDTKPGLYFEAGICSACLEYKHRANVDWAAREKDFRIIVQTAKARKGEYDCIIPVSGGKDSHYQVIKALEYELRPLAVNVRTCHLSDIGRKNLDNIGNLGVDCIEIVPNPVVRKRINKFALSEVGDISWPEHQLIFSVPIRVALEKNIPLIIWGENSQNEYGAGPKESAGAQYLDKRWLDEFGGLNGLRVSDIVDTGIATDEEMSIYKYPDLSDIIKPQSINHRYMGQLRPRGIFLGYYFPWNGSDNATIAIKHRFKTYYQAVEGNSSNYENLDNHQTGIHDHLKYLKFGFSRATDINSVHLRSNKRLERDIVAGTVKRYDGAWPATYLGKSLDDILNNIGMTFDEYTAICDKFVNRNLFKVNPNADLRYRYTPKFKIGVSDDT